MEYNLLWNFLHRGNSSENVSLLINFLFIEHGMNRTECVYFHLCRKSDFFYKRSLEDTANDFFEKKIPLQKSICS